MRIFLLVLIWPVLPGCSIHGSFQGLYSYYHKTRDAAPSLIKKPVLPLCDLVPLDMPVVYVVNGAELKNCIQHFEKSLVYIWRPKCSSEVCIPPMNIQTFCRTRHIELFVVAEYYDFPTMNLVYPMERPVFGIDCEHYSTNLTKKYVPMFLSDLALETPAPEDHYFFLFEYGCLKNSAHRLENLGI